MKNFFLTFTIIVAFVFSVACGNDKITANANQAVEQPKQQDWSVNFEPQMDISEIQTFNDFSDTKSEAWQRYSDRKSKAWEEYSTAKSKLFEEYSNFQKIELVKLRSANYEAYLQWLDAEKIGDYSKRSELERTVPAIKSFEQVTSEKYKAYEQAEQAAYARYKTIDENAYKIYQIEEDMAYKAYLSRKQQ